MVIDLIRELKRTRLITQSPRAIQKEYLSKVIEKYSDKYHQKLDDSYLIGFYDGYRSETGIPTPIITPTKKNNLI